MLAVIVSAMLCQFEGYEAVAQWMRLLPIEVWHAFGGTRRPPCANCYWQLMNAVCPVELQRALTRRITEGLGLDIQDQAAGIIIDGKVLRGTRSEHHRTMQILAAPDQHTGCVLSETQIAAETNKATTAIKFLKGLILQGKTVVGDAAYCQREVCETILSEHGEYLIVVKDKQPTLLRKRQARKRRRTASTLEKSRGRLDRRTLTATTVGIDTCNWPGVRQFLKLERTTTVQGGTKTSVVCDHQPRRKDFHSRRSSEAVAFAVVNRKPLVLGEGHGAARRP